MNPGRARFAGWGLAHAGWCALAALVVVGNLTAAAVAKADGVEVVFLANEGVLLADGRQSVLIDGCVREPYSGYGAVPEPVWRRLLAGEAPFDGLAVVLVSHAHADHFQPAAARELLLARSAARWVVHREVADAIADGWERWPEVRDRVSAVSLADGEVVTWRREGIEVELRRLPHGTARTLPENLAHVVRIGGRSVVHVGDAQASAADLERAGLASGGFDVALLPYWFWLGEEWRAARRALGGRLGTVAVHLPPGEQPPAAIAGEPAPLVLDAPLAARRF